VKLVGVAKGVQVELKMLPGEEVVVRNEVISWDFARPPHLHPGPPSFL
jgi:hypothetical protein